MRISSLVLLVLSTAAQAGSTADDIIEEARRAYRVENTVQAVKMVLVSKEGRERERSFELRVRRDGDVLSSYTRFLTPSDVAGTQLVLVDHPDQDDEQLLFLPALERVTRVSGAARSGAFLGSDFRYTDFEMDLGSGARHTIADESAEAWTIETIPGSGSDWSRIRTRVLKANHLPEKTSFYGKAGDLQREMTLERVEVKDGVTVPMRTVMQDLKRKTSTRLEVQEVRVKVPAAEIPPEMFTAAYLERNG